MKKLNIILFLLIATFLMAAAHDMLKPMLIDLPGWVGEEADGMSMDMSGMKMIQATREYSKGKQSLTAIIMVSNQASATAIYENPMNIQTDGGSVKTVTIDGFNVIISHDNEDNESIIFIILKKEGVENAFLSINGKNLDTEELLNLAKIFDWKKVKSVVGKM